MIIVTMKRNKKLERHQEVETTEEAAVLSKEWYDDFSQSRSPFEIAIDNSMNGGQRMIMLHNENQKQRWYVEIRDRLFQLLQEVLWEYIEYFLSQLLWSLRQNIRFTRKGVVVR